MTQEAMYESIGTQFEEFTNSAKQRPIETRTFFHMVGDVKNKTILDLACGFGYFGRELFRRGAAKVVGVDISPTMIELARTESARNNENIEYHVRNVADMEQLGQFDLVTAAWLFNYAESEDELERMFQAVAANLRPEGKLIAYTVNPDYKLERGNFTPYGVTVLNEQAHHSGFRCDAQFVTNPPSPFTFFRWGRDVYERAIRKAGFKTIHWQVPLLSQQEIDANPKGYWDTFKDNCLQTGLVCTF